MKKILLVLSILALVSFTGCGDNKVEKQDQNEVVENQISQDVIEEVAMNEESVRGLKEYAITNLQMTEEECEKNIIDIDKDGNVELVQIVDEYPGGFKLWCIDSTNNVVEMKVLENNEERALSDGNYMIYKTKDKNSNGIIYFMSEYLADGLCYQNRTVYKLKKDETNLILEKIFNYSCDGEVEEKTREEIRNNSNITDEEMLEALYNAHVLEYAIAGEDVTEEKFNEYINSLKENYGCIQIINDYVLELKKDKLSDLSSSDLKDVSSAHIGYIRLAGKEYRLSYDKNDEYTFSLNAYGEDDDNKIELVKWNKDEPIEVSELTIFKDKYLVIALKNPYGENTSALKIYDETMKKVEMDYTGVIYDTQTNEFKYEVQEDKIIVSEYKFMEPTQDSYHNLYRVDYEIIEKDGKLIRNTIKEDKNDTAFTAAT